MLSYSTFLKTNLKVGMLIGLIIGGLQAATWFWLCYELKDNEKIIRNSMFWDAIVGFVYIAIPLYMGLVKCEPRLIIGVFFVLFGCALLR